MISLLEILALFTVLTPMVCSNEMLELEKSWVSHKRKFSLIFDKNEDLKRKMIFKDNMDFVKKHNSQGHSYTVTMNMFSHLTDQEMDDTYGRDFESETTQAERLEGQALPDPPDLDWRNRDAVTRVKDEGVCAGSYAFATVGSMESGYKVQKLKLIALSEQDVLDCSRGIYGNKGCAGGSIENTFRYAIERGINREFDYQFKGEVNTCLHSTLNFTVTPKGYFILRSGAEDQLSNAVSSSGPVANGIRMTKGFRFYKDGVFNETGPCLKTPNLALLTIGIGSSPKHYTIKNSWGYMWGDQGFAKILRYNDNMCGIATWGFYPTFY